MSSGSTSSASSSPSGDATPRVLPAFTDGDEPQEHLPDCPLAVGSGRREDAVRSCGQGPTDTPDLLEGRECEPIAFPSLEQLGERVLKERKRAGLVRDVGDDLRHEPGFGHDADRFGRPSDRLLQLVGRERWDRLRPRREQLAEAWVHQRSVVEVGTERDDDAEPALGIGCRHAQGLEEQLTLMFVGSEGEDLLELVNNQDERRGFRKHEVQRFEEPSRVAIQQVMEL